MMPSILPRSVDLRSGRWWTLVTLLAVATFFAAIGSYAITLTDLMISPMLLAPGIGTALIMRWGYSIWPGLLAGDLIGQLMVRARAWTHISLPPSFAWSSSWPPLSPLPRHQLRPPRRRRRSL
ncbi:MAG: hypothetical protein WCI83_08215 [Thermoleophilia bacterium]